VIDEAMWEYKGKSDYVVFVERKPKPLGIRAYLHCFEMKNTDRAVVYQVLPDIRRPCYRPSEVLSILTQELPQGVDVEITTDCYFANLNWLRIEPRLFTMAVVDNNIGGLADLFCHNMKLHEFRVFEKDNILLSAWIDRKRVLCASNAFRLTNAPVLRAQGYDVAPQTPLMSMDMLTSIENALTLEQIKAIGAVVGVSGGTSKRDVLLRIARYPPQAAVAEAGPVLQPPQPQESYDARLKRKCDELANRSVKSLNEMLKIRKLSRKGNKGVKVLRLAQRELMPENEKDVRAELSMFLQPTATTIGEQRPIINQHYRDTFNLVDKYNRLVSEISYQPRSPSDHMRMFVGVVEIAIVNTWSLYHSWFADQPQIPLRDFAIRLSKQLFSPANE
jgi:hypothetical protein